MGIYNGSVSFSRYRITGGPKRLTISKLSELLEPFKAASFRIDGSKKAEAIGWVRPLIEEDSSWLDEEAHWDVSDCRVEGGIMLRIRYERRKVPTSLLQMIFRQKLADHLKSTGKNMGRLDRQKLKEDLTHDLMKRTLPQIQFTDVLWRDQHQELLIFNSSKTNSERVIQLFHQTFADPLDLTICGLTSTTAWIETEEPELRLSLVAKTEPAVFARQIS